MEENNSTGNRMEDLTQEEQQIYQSLLDTYVYGFPVVMLELTKRNVTNTVKPADGKAPINQLAHGMGLACAENKEIVMLNIDTVYSQAYFDLRQEPLLFHKPASERYFSVQLLDAYGNCGAIFGSGGLLGDQAADFAILGPDFSGTLPEGVTPVRMSTNLSWALLRIVSGGAKDQAEVEALQRQTDLRPLSYYGKEYYPEMGSYHPEYEYVPFEKIRSMPVEEFFQMFNDLLGANPGPENDQDLELLARVKKYGVGDGMTFSMESFSRDLQKQLRVLPYQFEKLMNGKKDVRNITNGWVCQRDHIARFGKDYLYRAQVAYGGLGANPTDMCLYYAAMVDDQGNTLSGKKRYEIMFEQEPPVDAFWSLTAYGTDKFLIVNTWNRYGVNDQSNLKRNRDGSFTIYVQGDQPEEAGQEENWLPHGDKDFLLVLRLYIPKKTVLNGDWKPPVIHVV